MCLSSASAAFCSPLTPSGPTPYCCTFLALLGGGWWCLSHLDLSFASWWGSVMSRRHRKRVSEFTLPPSHFSGALGREWQISWAALGNLLPVQLPVRAPGWLSHLCPSSLGVMLLSALPNAFIKMCHQKLWLTCQNG